MKPSSSLQASVGEKGFPHYCLSQAISIMGDWSQNILINVLIYGASRDVGMLSVSVTLTFLPNFLGLTTLGRWLDHFSRRGFLCIARLTLMALAMVCWGCISTHQAIAWLLIPLFLVNMIDAVAYSASEALVQDMLPERKHEDALYALRMGANVGGLIGGYLGGTLTIFFPENPEVVCIVNAVSYLPGVLWLLRNREIGSKRLVPRGEKALLREAWHSFWQDSEKKYLLTLRVSTNVTCMSGRILQPVVGYELLGGTRAYTLILMSSMFGSIVVALSRFWIKQRALSKRWLQISEVVVAGLTVLYGILAATTLSIIMVMSAMVILAAVSSIRGTSGLHILRLNLPEKERGRNNALISAADSVSILMGSLFAGLLVFLAGVRVAIIGPPVLGLLLGLILVAGHHHQKQTGV